MTGRITSATGDGSRHHQEVDSGVQDGEREAGQAPKFHPMAPSVHARSREEAVLIAGGPVAWPGPVPHVPDLAFVRSTMPDRADRHGYLIHALRFFEDVLAYAERLEAERG